MEQCWSGVVDDGRTRECSTSLHTGEAFGVCKRREARNPGVYGACRYQDLRWTLCLGVGVGIFFLCCKILFVSRVLGSSVVCTYVPCHPQVFFFFGLGVGGYMIGIFVIGKGFGWKSGATAVRDSLVRPPASRKCPVVLVDFSPCLPYPTRLDRCPASSAGSVCPVRLLLRQGFVGRRRPRDRGENWGGG